MKTYSNCEHYTYCVKLFVYIQELTLTQFDPQFSICIHYIFTTVVHSVMLYGSEVVHSVMLYGSEVVHSVMLYGSEVVHYVMLYGSEVPINYCCVVCIYYTMTCLGLTINRFLFTAAFCNRKWSSMHSVTENDHLCIL